MGRTVSIITPWLNNPQLIQTYEPSVQGAQVIIVDNGSREQWAGEIRKMVDRLNGKYIRNEDNRLFAPANNQGLEVADGEIVLFLNNDIKAYNLVKDVQIDITPKIIGGPSKMKRMVAGVNIPYIEGFCIAAYKSVWEDLGGWNEKDYKGLYWEDNDLCFRALQKGYELKETRWDVWHFNNFTSRNTPGAYDHSAHNQHVFEEMVRNAAL